MQTFFKIMEPILIYIWKYFLYMSAEKICEIQFEIIDVAFAMGKETELFVKTGNRIGIVFNDYPQIMYQSFGLVEPFSSGVDFLFKICYAL